MEKPTQADLQKIIDYRDKMAAHWQLTSSAFEGGYCPLGFFQRVMLELGFEIEPQTDLDDDYLDWRGCQSGHKRRLRESRRVEAQRLGRWLRANEEKNHGI